MAKVVRERSNAFQRHPLAWLLRLAPLMLGTVLFAGLLGVAHASKGEWKLIDEDDGIKVWKLEVPGEDMPGFRGQTVMRGTPQVILDVLENVDAHEEWMHRCVESRIVRKLSDERAVLYNRTSAPWPVWDRDVVVETLVTRSEDGKRIVQKFHGVDTGDVPLPKKVVRMPKLEGKYDLTEISPGKTRVDYIVEVDVGGSIPTWIAKRVAKDMPFKTLKKLERRVQTRLSK